MNRRRVDAPPFILLYQRRCERTILVQFKSRDIASVFSFQLLYRRKNLNFYSRYRFFIEFRRTYRWLRPYIWAYCMSRDSDFLIFCVRAVRATN